MYQFLCTFVKSRFRTQLCHIRKAGTCILYMYTPYPFPTCLFYFSITSHPFPYHNLRTCAYLHSKIDYQFTSLLPSHPACPRNVMYNRHKRNIAIKVFQLYSRRYMARVDSVPSPRDVLGKERAEEDDVENRRRYSKRPRGCRRNIAALS